MTTPAASMSPFQAVQAYQALTDFFGEERTARVWLDARESETAALEALAYAVAGEFPCPSCARRVSQRSPAPPRWAHTTEPELGCQFTEWP